MASLVVKKIFGGSKTLVLLRPILCRYSNQATGGGNKPPGPSKPGPPPPRAPSKPAAKPPVQQTTTPPKPPAQAATPPKPPVQAATKPKPPVQPPKVAPAPAVVDATTYKNAEYFQFNEYSFYDIDAAMSPSRMPQPSKFTPMPK